MSNAQPNPLKIHSIIILVLGALLITVGIIQMVRGSSGKAPRRGGASRAMSEQRAAKGRITGMKSTARSLTKKPKSARDLMNTGRRLKGAKNQVKSLLKTIFGAGMPLLTGLLTVAAGIFMLKRKNWARYVGFTCASATVLGFCSYLGAKAAAPSEGLVLPIILTIVIAGICSKFLWDLMIEEFATA
jgi:hypothetical protein